MCTCWYHLSRTGSHQKEKTNNNTGFWTEMKQVAYFDLLQFTDENVHRMHLRNCRH